jgi:hypothetical protein
MVNINTIPLDASVVEKVFAQASLSLRDNGYTKYADLMGLLATAANKVNDGQSIDLSIVRDERVNDANNKNRE